MRIPSRMTRSRTSFFVSDRKAALISLSRPSNSSASFSWARALTRLVSASRSSLPAMVRAWASSAETSRATAS